MNDLDAAIQRAERAEAALRDVLAEADRDTLAFQRAHAVLGFDDRRGEAILRERADIEGSNPAAALATRSATPTDSEAQRPAETPDIGVERLARALMVAANNGDRETTQTAYTTAIRVLEALATRDTDLPEVIPGA